MVKTLGVKPTACECPRIFLGIKPTALREADGMQMVLMLGHARFDVGEDPFFGLHSINPF